jgi:hypothetical protein
MASVIFVMGFVSGSARPESGQATGFCANRGLPATV